MGAETTTHADAGSTDERGKFRVVLRLSEGGTANIFLGVAHGQGGFKKLVVLKVPKQHVLQETEARRMFLNEARLAARLNHGNIVQTIEVIDPGGHPIIVMEYLEGQALSSILGRARDALPMPMHLAILGHALSGLHYAHEYADFDGVRLNIVHRDMTPHNVFVTYDGHVKILDFGIAKLDRAEGGTETGVIKGKIRYMPPEQITGETVDRRADVFAVGVMLWEAAARQRMWPNDSDAVIMHRIVNGEIPAPSTVNPDVSPELERIVMKALAAEADDRYATAADVLADLDAFRSTLIQHAAMDREIGKFVASVFADVREDTKRAIEAKLSKVASLSWAEYLESENALAVVTVLQHAETGTTKPVEAVRAPSKRGIDMRSGVGLAVAAFVAAAAALLVPLLKARHGEPPAHAPAQADAVASAQAPEPAPSESAAKTTAPPSVTVSISASPPEAKLYFDDTELQTNPFSGQMPRDGAMHRVRAEASGHATTTTGITLDNDATIVLTLEKERPNAALRRPRGTGPGPRPNVIPTASPVAMPKVDCSPPYWVDERGIKRFKPECL
jgi:serine/threonine-protein kinase